MHSGVHAYVVAPLPHLADEMNQMIPHPRSLEERYSNEILTLYDRGYALVAVVTLSILPLGIKFTPWTVYLDSVCSTHLARPPPFSCQACSSLRRGGSSSL